jgi:hypothetical protein
MGPALRKTLLGVTFKRTQLDMLRAIWDHQIWNSEMDQSSFWGTGVYERDVSQEYDEDALSVDEEDDRVDGEDDEERDQDVDEDEEDEESGGEEGEGYDGEEYGEEEYDGGDDEASNEKEIELTELMFELSIHFASEEFEDGQPRSSLLVYFSGVLGLSDDGLTFRRAKQFTTRLSGLIYVLRLLFLEYALPYRKYTHLGIDRRPRHKHLERLNAIRYRFMLYGCLTPLGEF